VSQPEFRERTFEYPLLAELDRDQRTVYQPDQVLEHLLGFDAGVLTKHALFWRRLGTRALHGEKIRANWFKPAPTKPLWNRPLNAFLQFKCPERVARGTAREWDYWKKPYFRFKIEADQQSALEACSKGLGNNGVVAYSSPAFWTLAELSKYQSHRQVVHNTHFVKATALSGHKSYSYCAAASDGCAHSDPEPVASLTWEDLARLSEQADRDRGADSIVHEAAEGMRHAMASRPVLSRVWQDFLGEIAEALRAFSETPFADMVGLLREFVATSVAADMLGLTWRVVASQRGNAEDGRR
jgi:hypothetical protein